MDPRDEAEPDYATVSPYDSIVSKMAALGQEKAGIELARETWTAIQDEKIKAWVESRGKQRDRELSPSATPPTASSESARSPPPNRRREPEQLRETTPEQHEQPTPDQRESASPASREQRSPDRQRRPASKRRGQRTARFSPSGDVEDNRRDGGKEDDDEEAKPTFTAKIVRGQAVDSETTYQPDPKIVAQLASGKFVPLWHFVERNCKSAALRQALAGDGELTVKVEGKSLNVSQDTHTKGALRDDQISYNDFHHAQPMLVAKMSECRQYSSELVDGLIDMFHALDRHPIRKKDFGDLAVQRYADSVRFEWHSKLKDKEIFDIGEIGEERLRAIHQEILDEERKNV